MRFRVVWKQGAEHELTRLWLGSRFRSDLTDAASTIDEDLQRNPVTAGESRDGSLRILFVPPLAVLFEVEVAARLVVVVHVWRVRR